MPFFVSRYFTFLTFFADIYGDLGEPSHVNGSANGAGPTKNKRTVVHLSLCDSLPAYGPIADMTFSLAKNGVSVLV